jgi:hypothetical protein
VLRWRRGLIDDPSHDPWLPFFIQWDVPDELHPGRTPAAHCVRPTGIARVDIGGDDRRLRPLLGNAGLPLRAVGGEPGLRAVVLSLTGRGIVTL